MSEQIKVALAQSPGTPAETLVRLAGDEDWNVRRSVAQNPNTPGEILERLVGDEDWAVRTYVIKNPSIPEEILVRLAGDKDGAVRGTVARNTNTPVEIMVRLAGDEDWRVRRGVAQNPNTPEEILVRLAGDEDETVRLDAALNPNTPEEYSLKARILTPLKKHGVVRVELRYSGGGDCGDVDETIPYDGAGCAVEGDSAVTEALKGFETIFWSQLGSRFGGWENNEGGSGEARLHVEDETVEVDHCSYYDTDGETYSARIAAPSDLCDDLRKQRVTSAEADFYGEDGVELSVFLRGVTPLRVPQELELQVQKLMDGFLEAVFEGTDCPNFVMEDSGGSGQVRILVTEEIVEISYTPRERGESDDSFSFRL